MFNMRIDVVRKELERRFREVEELKGQDDVIIKNAADRFMYFLLMEPDIKPFILKLANFNEDFLKSDKYNEIARLSISAIQNIINEIDKASFIDREFQENFGPIWNIYELSNPDINNRLMSLDQFLGILREADNNKYLILNGLADTIDTLSHILEIAGNQKISCNNDKIIASISQLRHCIVEGAAYVKYKAIYVGAISLRNLLFLYGMSNYRYLSGPNLDVLISDFRNSRINAQSFGERTNGLDDIIGDCRQVYHAVDKYLMTGKSKSALIERLRTYCTWIRREDFPKTKTRNKEDKISKIVTEFIFNQGYFPIVRFKTGRSEPDILYEPSGDIHWDNSVLIELKQYMGKPYSEKQFKTDIGQAGDYLSIVKGVKSDIADSVYLLVFYDGDKRYVLDESFSDDNVQVEFIYVGEKTPSKLKDENIFGKQ